MQAVLVLGGTITFDFFLVVSDGKQQGHEWEVLHTFEKLKAEPLTALALSYEYIYSLSNLIL